MCKTQRAQRRVKGSSQVDGLPKPIKFGECITCDHKVLSPDEESAEAEGDEKGGEKGGEKGDENGEDQESGKVGL